MGSTAYRILCTFLRKVWVCKFTFCQLLPWRGKVFRYQPLDFLSHEMVSLLRLAELILGILILAGICVVYNPINNITPVISRIFVACFFYNR